MNNLIDGWKHSDANIFWGEIAPCDHVLQIYETEGVFLDALAGFVGAGINSNDSCIVIATQQHIEALENRLTSYGVSIPHLKKAKRYFPYDAAATLATFMVNGWPDEAEFNKTVRSMLTRARGDKKRNIRAFGEMVAILWAQGNTGATVNLEHLWNKFALNESFCLFCAYPKSGFTEDISNSMQDICCAHSKMIDGAHKQLTEVIYTETEHKRAI
jgi:hypothetical protein